MIASSASPVPSRELSPRAPSATSSWSSSARVVSWSRSRIPVVPSVAATPDALVKLAPGRDPRLGLDREVSFEPVLPAMHGLMGVPRLGVHDADHPVRGDAAGDLPAPVGAVGPGRRLDVLARDQRQQRDRLGRRPVETPGAEDLEQRESVADQRIDQDRAGFAVVARAHLRLTPDCRSPLRTAPPSVTTSAAPGTSRRTLRYHRDQLRHGVLGRDRIIKDGRRPVPAGSCH